MAFPFHRVRGGINLSPTLDAARVNSHRSGKRKPRFTAADPESFPSTRRRPHWWRSTRVSVHEVSWGVVNPVRQVLTSAHECHCVSKGLENRGRDADVGAS